MNPANYHVVSLAEVGWNGKRHACQTKTQYAVMPYASQVSIPVLHIKSCYSALDCEIQIRQDSRTSNGIIQVETALPQPQNISPVCLDLPILQAQGHGAGELVGGGSS